MSGRILIVDDEKLIRWSLAKQLKQEGFEILEAGDVASAVETFTKEPVDLAFLDLKLPDGDGIGVLKKFQAHSPDTPVIIITAFSSVGTAVDAMKLGAYDYLTKPLNMDELAISVRRALETRTLRTEVDAHVREAKTQYGLVNVVGQSPRMQAIFGLVRRIAQNDSAVVLLRGESGTGKDVIARAIHYESARAQKPFVNITCTALPETLLESELFGHEKGAFTDAKVQKRGLFEFADAGTVFLDEIGDMSAMLQAKLLRVLEERTFRRIGGTQDIKVDVRVIAATNRDLEKAIEEHRFREDLYYRLNIIPVVIPPLRDRLEDLPLLVSHFVRHFSREFKKSLRGVDKAGMALLTGYGWPGNVRELKNVLERACFLATGPEITSDDLLVGRAAYSGRKAANEAAFKIPPEGLILDDVEKEFVRQALERTAGHQTRAATLIGITRDQMRYKMKKYGIQDREANQVPTDRA